MLIHQRRSMNCYKIGGGFSMLTLTNPKISRFTQATGESRGVTILFDHLGGQLAQVGPNLYRLRCQVMEDVNMRLYRGLLRGRAEVGTTSHLLGAGLIDAAALHVTFTDLFHSGNIESVIEPHRQELKEFFGGLPHSLASEWPESLRTIE